ncbi:MAG TPA: hypothetical protein VFD49_13115 [Candidatus Dormibacteraeota bacterium]|nr:hypothetical protein [Candidatus Dormibacteraeota bacterium]
MKAVVYEGPGRVSAEGVDDPGIKQPTDAVARMTSPAPCGRHLHVHEGRTAAGAEPEREQATPVIEDLPQPANANGSVNLTGVYPPADPGAHGLHAKASRPGLPPGLPWNRAITVAMGQAILERYHVKLRSLIRASHPEPGFIVSQRSTLASAPMVLEGFGQRAPRCSRVLFRPALEVAT